MTAVTLGGVEYHIGDMYPHEETFFVLSHVTQLIVCTGCPLNHINRPDLLVYVNIHLEFPCYFLDTRIALVKQQIAMPRRLYK